MENGGIPSSCESVKLSSFLMNMLPPSAATVFVITPPWIIDYDVCLVHVLASVLLEITWRMLLLVLLRWWWCFTRLLL